MKEKWTHWYVITWINPEADLPERFRVGAAIGTYEHLSRDIGSLTKDGRDFCEGYKVKKLCKIPQKYAQSHSKNVYQILRSKIDRMNLQGVILDAV